LKRGRATVFAQLLEFLPAYEFNKSVSRYEGNKRVRSFSCYDQFIAMAFAQLTQCDGLRAIETCFRVAQRKLYHCGLRGRVTKSTLADANNKRDWRIFSEFAYALIAQARQLNTGEKIAVDLKREIYALDSTTIDLCLELFPWAKFRRTKAAVKMHTLLDLRGSIPTVVHVTHGKVHDVHFLDQIAPEIGAIYIMDRAYNDFARLYRFAEADAFFVVREKRRTQSRVTERRDVDEATGLRCDQTIVLTGVQTKRKFPRELRRVRFYDEEQERSLVFLTNNFRLAPLTIAKLYKSRWVVELFFKWIKQNLRIKAFYGTSDNAVKSQIWIAISVYCLVAIVRQELRLLDFTMSEILQILSFSLFEKTPISAVFREREAGKSDIDLGNQRLLFDS
jgi:hypothetical protein